MLEISVCKVQAAEAAGGTSVVGGLGKGVSEV